MPRQRLNCAVLLIAASLLLRGELFAQAQVPGLKLSDETVFDIRMTTSFAAPANGAPISNLRIFHALPTIRPWTKAGLKFGAADLKFAPAGGVPGFDAAHGAHYVLWAAADPVPPGNKIQVTSEFQVTSYTREFTPAGVKVAWADYAKPSKDRSAVVNVAVARNLLPELAQVADNIKSKHAPPDAVLEMCKWIKENVRYDASVTHQPQDVASTVRAKCGHCGHQFAVLEQLATRAGIPVRKVAGMNLYAEDGKTGPLQQVRADYTNIHTWAEVYFPNVGWIELDPGEGGKAFQLHARYIQNNRWFQNYTIRMIEGRMEKQPTWTARAGGFDSAYGVEHLISYKAAPAKK